MKMIISIVRWIRLEDLYNIMEKKFQTWFFFIKKEFFKIFLSHVVTCMK